MNYTTKLYGLLAVLILLGVSLACSDAGAEEQVSNANQAETTRAAKTVEPANEFALDKAEMRVNEDGEMGADATSDFSRSEKVIHCYVNWDNPKIGSKIRFAYYAVDAGGAKNLLIKEFSMTTENELQNEAYGKLKPTKPLPVGSYKVEIYVNDKLARTVPFTIS